ncbi:MAG: CHASE2 domain-containing protein [Campylobacter sp.]
MSKKLKKFLVYLSSSLLVVFAMSGIYVFYPTFLESIDGYFKDALFNVRGERENSGNIVIVDIDETSISELGQWPWSRDKIARIVENLNSANAAIVGFDVLFSEPDEHSPSVVFKKFNLPVQIDLNYDEIFAKSLEKMPCVLGYQFQFGSNSLSKNLEPQSGAVFIERGRNDQNSKFLIKANGVISNLELLQNSAFSSGFFNNIPDESGVIRSVPLVISYNDALFSSLALEIIRIVSGSKKFQVIYSQNGIDGILLDNGTFIPTDKFGKIFVNFRGKQGNFKYLSAEKIYNNDFDKSQVEDKIILIGASATGLLDMRSTPFDAIFPGVEVHANVIDNILQNDFISKPSWIDGVNLSVIFLFALVVSFFSLAPFWLRPFLAVGLLVGYIFCTYVCLFSFQIILNIVFAPLTIAFSFVITTLLDYFYSVKKEIMLRSKFAKKVSQNVMNDLLNSNSENFKATQREVSVFFSDIRNFTTITEKMNDSQKLIQYLNSYLEPMSNAIMAYNGTIDKYIGDAIMAYWNAPLEVKNHADLAVKAALAQIKKLDELNKNFEIDGLARIKIGIGINTGSAIVGEVGSSARSDYTIIGDTVNLGSRLEEISKIYGTIINISDFTKQNLKENYSFRFVDNVKIRGKNSIIKVWEVICNGEPNLDIKSELENYENALKLYNSADFKGAKSAFEMLIKNSFLDKRLYQIYLQKCLQNI